MKPCKLITPRLYLRSSSKSDVQILFDNYCSDEDRSKFLAREAHRSVEQTSNFLNLWCKSAWENDFSDFAWVIAIKKTNTPIGVFIVKSQSDIAEIHYGISRDCESQGYITEAGAAVVEWLKTNTNIKIVRTECDVENYGSIKVLEKLGFKNVGHIKNGLYLPAFGKNARDCYRFEMNYSLEIHSKNTHRS